MEQQLIFTKNAVYPIPLDEINLNETLTQNDQNPEC